MPSVRLVTVSPARTMVAAAWLAALAGAAAAGQATGPAFPPDPQVAASLPASDYQPHYQRGGNVSETWTYVFGFEGGYFVNAQFMITNIGPGDFTGAAIAYLLAPDGDVAVIKNSRQYGEWSDRSGDDGLDLGVANNRLQVRHPRHQLTLRHSAGELELSAETTSDMLQPGRVTVEEGGWYDLTLFAPRMRATATLRMAGREPVTLESGHGIAIHSLTNLADDRLATAWLRLDTFDAPEQVSMFELMTSERAGRHRLGLALQFRDGRLVGHGYRYGRRLTDVVADPEKSANPIVGGLRFGVDDAIRYRGTARLELLSRNELLQFLSSPVLRFVLKLLSDPVLYQYRADYEVEFDFDTEGARTVRGRGFVSLYVLDRPPAAY